MENNTLSFIQLVKSILEYYGTTKDMKPKEVAQEMSGLERAESIIENFDDFDMDNIFVESDSGAGLVTARFNGNKELLELKIDDSLYGKEDKELQKDLIIAAVNKGIKAAEDKSKEHLQKATQGMLPNIPGMDLNSMM